MLRHPGARRRIGTALEDIYVLHLSSTPSNKPIRKVGKQMNNKQRFGGIIPPTVTPLKEDESLDVAAVAGIVEHCLGNGASGLFVNGTTGEAMRVTDLVWRANMQAVIKAVKGRAPVFCGAIEASTARVLEKIRMIEADGGDVAVCATPFYLASFGQDEILRHFDRICNSSKVEIAVYNIPECTGANILPETVAKLAEYDNIVAYKDSTADWQQLQRVLFALQDSNIAIFNGAEELCAVAMLFGAQGCIPGLANFVPQTFVALVEACAQKDLDKSRALQKQINGIRQSIFTSNCWMSGMKYLMEVFGFGGHTLSAPLQPLQKAQREQALALLRANGVKI